MFFITALFAVQVLACGSSVNGGADAADASNVPDASGDAGSPDAAETSDGSINAPVAEFIVFAKEPSQFDSYMLLASSAVAVSFRSPSPHPSDQDAFEAQGRAYYFTAASSDYPNFEKEPLYVDLKTIDIVAARKHCSGFYLHEVMTVISGAHDWNWQIALDEFDWAWMDALVVKAKAQGKKVIWSEPSYAWQTMDASPVAAAHFATWGTTVIPMFATNFPTQIDNCREHARAIAQRYGLPLGESHQSWYFIDSGIDVTREGSFTLAKVTGWDYGATLFQFEGTSMDLYWESPYMLGIRDFAKYLLN